ncbi:nucleotidyltransferase domain-containing protein [Ligilactobacillus salivarius]|uniref:nucleotidyltransferase domain-containing protein n=1 Tax=Ligilactobacillus salivarius TaxID=1624 RepID=UPI001651B59B|nr:nucleotidyltransferase [Ligilactobacillus salivarius]MBC6925373.1 nucleotidyltransferase [Ligilactobacillus salivarius]
MFNRDREILASLSDLDLSPTMEKNARDKYAALSSYLDEKGLDSDFYPQGSFLIGTTIRPYRNGKDHDYDLDVLAILKRNKIETNARKVKNDVGNCIKESNIYSDKLEKEDRNCWTLKYAEVSKGIGFSLDVIPSVDETISVKRDIVLSGVPYSQVEKTIAITDKKVDTYDWLTSNPLGFGDWFIEISNRHLTDKMKIEQYNNLPGDMRMEFASVEEIPTYYYKSNLQRAVQFIKRHRDIYYDRSKLINEKPASILISALVADSVKDEYFLSVSDIVNIFIVSFINKNISIMKDGKILNPVDLRENLIEQYTENRLNNITRWILELNKFMNVEDRREFQQNIHNDINTRVFTKAFENPTIITPTKPWRN